MNILAKMRNHNIFHYDNIELQVKNSQENWSDAVYCKLH